VVARRDGELDDDDVCLRACVHDDGLVTPVGEHSEILAVGLAGKGNA
jgi:hypothetical protein